MPSCLAPLHGLADAPLDYDVARQLGHGQRTHDMLNLAAQLDQQLCQWQVPVSRLLTAEKVKRLAHAQVMGTSDKEQATRTSHKATHRCDFSFKTHSPNSTCTRQEENANDRWRPLIQQESQRLPESTITRARRRAQHSRPRKISTPTMCTPWIGHSLVVCTLTTRS